MKNFDSKRDSAAGIVIRDVHGKPLSAASSQVRRASVTVAKALALRDNLVKAKVKGFTRVKVEGDFKLAIEAVNGRIEPP
ncbi:hypothetical protein ACLB2K_012015 [Fragaria x ananassa]